MVGIIQEQHPDRAGLFMQWKEMGWPLLVDSYDLLEVPYVPITLAIDEQGVIRSILPPLQKVGELGEEFLSQTYAGGAVAPARPEVPDLAMLEQGARSSGTADAWRSFGNAVAVWGGTGRVGTAIEAFREVVRLEPEDGMAHFRLGVAYRMRYDSDGRQANDFQNAVHHWGSALEIDPNQYIWRRRIQQYGPRLDKPYPFYDWVHDAREEIRARGDEPVALIVEPRGSEFARPARTFAAAADETAEPDPMGRVLRDQGEFIQVEAVTVPAVLSPGGASRIHLTFQPIVDLKAHWNNEAEDMVLWVDPPTGWDVERRMFTYPVPEVSVSQEARVLEIEVRAGESVHEGPVRVPAYALYYVCEDVHGVCMYRRQDVELEVTVKR
jgi:hypothetical protein